MLRTIAISNGWVNIIIKSDAPENEIEIALRKISRLGVVTDEEASEMNRIATVELSSSNTEEAFEKQFIGVLRHKGYHVGVIERGSEQIGGHENYFGNVVSKTFYSRYKKRYQDVDVHLVPDSWEYVAKKELEQKERDDLTKNLELKEAKKHTPITTYIIFSSRLELIFKTDAPKQVISQAIKWIVKGDMTNDMLHRLGLYDSNLSSEEVTYHYEEWLLIKRLKQKGYLAGVVMQYPQDQLAMAKYYRDATGQIDDTFLDMFLYMEILTKNGESLNSQEKENVVEIRKLIRSTI